MYVCMYTNVCLCIYTSFVFVFVLQMRAYVRQGLIRVLIIRQSGTACSAVNSRQVTLSQAKLIQPYRTRDT